METIFLSDALIAAIAVVWLFAATLQDIKRREVANWLSFSLIIAALGIRAIASIIVWQPFYFLYGILMTAIFFVVANIFYYARIFAGGDAKLIIALAAAFATTPVFALKQQHYFAMFAGMPFIATFLINMLFIGSVYGLFCSIVLALMHFKQVKAEFKKISKKMRRAIILGFAFFIAFASASLIAKEILLFALGLMFLSFLYLFIFVKAVENSCMTKDTKPGDLREGDWLFKPLRFGKRVIMPSWEGLTDKDIALIKKSRIKSIIIKQGIPFVPVFLIALIFSFFTNLLEFLVRLFI